MHDEMLELTGGLKGVNPTNLGYLESALEHIEHIKNDDHCPTFESKIAHLFFSCVKSYPFPDGNKRTAIRLCMHLFLINEGKIPDDLEEKLEKVVLDVAENKISKDELKTIFENFSVKAKQECEDKNIQNTTFPHSIITHKRL